MLIGGLAALLGAVGYGTATVMQAHGVSSPSSPTTRGRSLLLAGLVLDGAAWLLSLLAFERLPLAVAQAVLASSVAVTAILAHLVLHTRIPRSILAAGGLFVVGAALVATTAGPTAPQVATPKLLAVAAVVLVCVALTAACVIGRGSSVLLASVSGTAVPSLGHISARHRTVDRVLWHWDAGIHPRPLRWIGSRCGGGDVDD